jgi:hypothetical protein
VLHGHEGGDEEGLVADFREEDHCKRKYEGVEWPDDAFLLVWDSRFSGLGALGDIEMVLVRRVGEGGCLVVRLVGDIYRLLGPDVSECSRQHKTV